VTISNSPFLFLSQTASNGNRSAACNRPGPAGSIRMGAPPERGGGEEFIFDVDWILDQLRQFLGSGKVYRERYRRLLIPKYPFGVFYVVETGRIVIHAIMDLRQDPKSIERRLGRT
jgi:hypothetical protein